MAVSTVSFAAFHAFSPWSFAASASETKSLILSKSPLSLSYSLLALSNAVFASPISFFASAMAAPTPFSISASNFESGESSDPPTLPTMSLTLVTIAWIASFTSCGTSAMAFSAAA